MVNSKPKMEMRNVDFYYGKTQALFNVNVKILRKKR